MSEGRSKLTLDVTEEMLAALDAWRALQPAIPDREAAALQLLERALEEAALVAAQTPGEP
jgi:hypothetical protein